MPEHPAAAEPYVFLSYTSRDRPRVLALADCLEAAGIRVWVDRRELVGGSSWDASIVDAIRDCTVFVLTCSAASLASPNVHQEVRLAWEEQRPVLPLLLEPVSIPRELRYPLAGRQWVELLDRAEDAWLPDVLRALAGLGLTPGAAPAAAPRRAAAPAAMHLPTPLTSFIGREQELAESTALLGTARLLTLTGPGGTGKTRLAIAAAAQVAASFADGVWFVDLSGVSDPADVIPAIAQVLDVRESESRSLAMSLAAHLRRKQVLLVLDNFEQVVAAALTLSDLLTEAPALALLVTSRILLRVPGEYEYAVPPLPVPEAGTAAPPEQLSHNPAIQLFVERARALRPDFRLSRENAASVADICRRLDGLPLAIELAAARVKLLPPPALLARLDRRLSLLSGAERGRPARQQTLRAAIAWSWDLLEPAEQVLFRRLGVFAGGFTLAAAEVVCGPDDERDVLLVLESLVDKSLVRQTGLHGEPRFSLLATLQEFALEQLQAAGEGEALRRAHAAYYCALAEEADAAYWRSGRARQDLLQPLDPERDNLFAALGWALAEQDAAVGLRLGGALGVWFYFRAPGEGLRWTEQLLGLPDVAALSGARGRSLWSAANCAIVRGDSQAGVAYNEEAAVCFRLAEDLPWLGRTLASLAMWLPAAEADRVPAVVEEALRLARAVGGTYDVAFSEALGGLALLLHGGNRAAIREHLEQALRLVRPLEADWLPIIALMTLGILAAAEGQHEEARALFHEGLPLAETLGDREAATRFHVSLAQVAAATGDQDGAAAHWCRALVAAQAFGNSAATALSLAEMAGLLSARQRPEQAVLLLAAADRLRQVAGQHPVYGPQLETSFRETMAATEAALSAEAFAQAWAAGQALSLDQAIDLALADLASPTAATNPGKAAAS